jgi:hypothetical protein
LSGARILSDNPAPVPQSGKISGSRKVGLARRSQ